MASPQNIPDLLYRAEESKLHGSHFTVKSKNRTKLADSRCPAILHFVLKEQEIGFAISIQHLKTIQF